MAPSRPAVAGSDPGGQPRPPTTIHVERQEIEFHIMTTQANVQPADVFKLEASVSLNVTKATLPPDAEVHALGEHLAQVLTAMFPDHGREISRAVSRAQGCPCGTRGYLILQRGAPALDWMLEIRRSAEVDAAVVVHGRLLSNFASEDLLVSSANWLLSRYGKGLNLRFWHTDREHRFTVVTDAPGSDHLSPQPASMVGRTRWECAGVSNPEADPRWRDHIARLNAGQTVEDFVYTVTGSNGNVTTWSVTATPVYDVNGQPSGHQGHALDVSDLYTARTSLSQSYEGIRKIVDDLPTVAAIWSRDFRLRHLSRVAAEQIGMPNELLLGKHALDIVNELGLEPLNRAPSDFLSEPDGVLVAVIDSSGQQRVWRQTVLAQLPGHDDDRICMYVDVTEAQRQAGKAQRRQQLESFGQFVGSLAHDLSNVVAVISGAVQSVRSGDPAEIDEALDDVGNMLASSQEMILALRGIAGGVGQGQQSTLDVSATLVRYVRSLNRGSGARVRIELRRPHIEVDVDPIGFERAVLNLIVNAREATGPDGEVRISLSAIQDGSQEFALITVDDDGPGFPTAVRQRIGELMLSTKEGAARGFGLAQVHAFASRYAGDFVVTDSPLGGGRVQLSLPATLRTGQLESVITNDLDHVTAAEVVTGDKVLPAIEASAPPEAPVVLIVDDHRPVRNMVERAFRQLGWTTRHAGTASEALNLLGEPGEVLPHLVLTDVVMPGMSGHELAQILGQKYPDLPVTLMSGHVPSGRQPELPLLQKPFSLADLQTILRLQGLPARDPLQSSESGQTNND